jgi:hypothetical protein
MASSESVRAFSSDTWKQPTLAQLGKLSCKCSKETPVTGPVIIGKAKYFYDEMKIIDKCTFSGG